jgi:hypothetical protein
MSQSTKKLVIEFESGRERMCKIVGTREGLHALADDLAALAEELPKPLTNSKRLFLSGWQQDDIEETEVGVYFQAEPDLDAYLSQKRKARSRILSWLRILFGLILVALVIIGFRTLVLWKF